jgi:pilus assembly protein CpaB
MASNSKQTAKFGAMGFAVLAFACAALFAFVLAKMIQARGLEQEKKVPVVVTTAAISAGESITRESLRIAIFPESNAPAGAVREIEPLFKDGKAPIAATGITAGEPLIASRLASAAFGTAMAARVKPGYRAVAVKVDNSVARAGLLYPGAHVDIVGTIRNSKNYISSSRIAIENVQVLSVESRIDVETQKPKEDSGGGVGGGGEKSDTVVTIEVTPEQAEKVVLAAREGKLDLALRNATDEQNVPTPGVSPSGFLSQNGAADSGEGKTASRGRSGSRKREVTKVNNNAAGAIETFHAK